MGRGKDTPLQIELKKILSTNLKNLMKSSAVSQTDLAMQTEIPRTTINGYVKGTSLPTAESSEKIAQVLNVPIEEFDPRYNMNYFDSISANKKKILLQLLDNVVQDLSREKDLDQYESVIENIEIARILIKS
ncbi:helix-turn-helix domain-containing protein [Jeotgalibacillus haloalkalitolerans]|uniref:Helix-turn-helix transcriptional regulator n=1 Tax=Jeotgalibacillus haloalkalitolerans TaxID=3104292 RepID=A0ABU5KQM3_9BACL|nr:helix-turn-helix transcriptional regulator [Jeotgalibacillus sp. HH7-29]MDZ5713556.1 helix-turn-helix transcriptional regulator [Jeotgalibacillus sp. HH7-29]